MPEQYGSDGGTGIAVSDTLFNTSKIAEKVIDMRMICDIKVGGKSF